MPLGMEVDLIVLHGDPAPPKGHTPPQFSAHVYCDQNGHPSELLLSTCCKAGVGH